MPTKNPTQKNIAKFYGTSLKTIANYKNAKGECLQNRYKAYRQYFIENVKEKESTINQSINIEKDIKWKV